MVGRIYKGERYRYNMEQQIFEKKRCSKCGSASVYTWRDGTVVCKSCGNTEKKEDKGGKQ